MSQHMPSPATSLSPRHACKRHRRRSKRMVATLTISSKRLRICHFLEHESLRNQVLLLVCYDGALRREECLRLRVDDIDEKSLTIKVRADMTKNRKERLVVLSPVTYQKLHQYVTRERSRLIEDYGGDSSGTIFLSESHRNPGQPLSVWTFQDVIKKVRKLVGTPALTP